MDMVVVTNTFEAFFLPSFFDLGIMDVVFCRGGVGGAMIISSSSLFFSSSFFFLSSSSSSKIRSTSSRCRFVSFDFSLS
jgi:hypothetical protein